MVKNKIRIIRELKNITQGELGKMINLNQSQISKIESGLRRVTTQEILKIATALGVSVTELLEEESANKAI